MIARRAQQSNNYDEAWLQLARVECEHLVLLIAPPVRHQAEMEAINWVVLDGFHRSAENVPRWMQPTQKQVHGVVGAERELLAVRCERRGFVRALNRLGLLVKVQIVSQSMRSLR